MIYAFDFVLEPELFAFKLREAGVVGMRPLILPFELLLQAGVAGPQCVEASVQ